MRGVAAIGLRRKATAPSSLTKAIWRDPLLSTPLDQVAVIRLEATGQVTDPDSGGNLSNADFHDGILQDAIWTNGTNCAEGSSNACKK